VVHGNLIVRAAADPSLSVKDVNRLARQVRAAGIRKVTGQLRVDIGSMSLRTTQTGWKADFVPDDIGPLSPFPVGRDWWRRDNAYLQHPTARNLQLFRDRLAPQGVRIRGGNLVVRDSNAHQVVAVHRSNPMRALVHRTLTYSDNFYAESLLTVAGGHRAVAQTTAAAGVTDRSEATDGSGLSYDDRETAAGEVQLLHYAFTSPARGPLVHALPIACKTGTLEHRFCGTIAAGAVFAKTGTLDHSRVLSGYTTDGLGRLVTFTVICAQVRNLTKAADATDRAVVLLRGYTG
jgi:D-alanyl-D-alanine carboxypeptidase/D-alanyl-D-alanine-endopeptidase (penicillin-binding protein 4)